MKRRPLTWVDNMSRFLTKKLFSIMFLLAAPPAIAWETLPVGEGANMTKMGADYYVSVECRKENGTTLALEIFRFIPPTDEIERFRSLTLEIETSENNRIMRDVDVVFTDDRDIKVSGQFSVSPQELDLFSVASTFTIRDRSTGKAIFTSDMKGGDAARNLFRQRCGI